MRDLPSYGTHLFRVLPSVPWLKNLFPVDMRTGSVPPPKGSKLQRAKTSCTKGGLSRNAAESCEKTGVVHNYSREQMRSGRSLTIRRSVWDSRKWAQTRGNRNQIRANKANSSMT